MTDPIVRFVTAPAPDADVRFDFHLNNGDSDRRTSDRQSWSWQPGAFLGEPDSIGSDEGFGQISFTHTVMGSRSEALRTMGALSRELRRDENYLLFQLDPASKPMWLKTFRASAGALTFPYIDPDADRDDVWLLDVTLPTESTSMGERESFTVTITNDPEAEDGLAVVLPEIKGDAPAPLVVEIPPTGVDTSRTFPLVSLAAIDGEWSGLEVWQVEDGDLDVDASVESSASASGGSWVSVSFASDASMQTRVWTGGIPRAAGRYRGFVRASAVGCAVTIKAQDSATATDRVTSTLAAGDTQMVDLGVFTFPAGNFPSGRPYELPTTDAVIGINARRDSGAGTLKLDAFVLIPVDLPLDQMAPPRTLAWAVTAGDAPPVFSIVVVDSDAERTTLLDRFTRAVYWPGVTTDYFVLPVGSFPQAVPGATNVLHFLPRRFDEVNWVDDLALSVDLTLSYAPRYVWLPSD